MLTICVPSPFDGQQPCGKICGTTPPTLFPPASRLWGGSGATLSGRDRHKAGGRWLWCHLVTPYLHKELEKVHGKEENGSSERDEVRMRASV